MTDKLSEVCSAILRYKPNLKSFASSMDDPEGNGENELDKAVMINEEQMMVSEFLRTIPMVGAMSGSQGLNSCIWNLARCMTLRVCRTGETIIHKGTISTHIYFIISGQVCVFVPKSLREVEIDEISQKSDSASEDLLYESDQAARYFRPATVWLNGKPVCLYKKHSLINDTNGACFGESILSQEQRYHETIVAESAEVILGMVRTDDFYAAFPLEADKRMFIEQSLLRHFSPALSDKTLSSLKVKFRETPYGRRTKLTGSMQSMWLLVKGTVSMMMASKGSKSRNYVIRINEGEFFGHENFLPGTTATSQATTASMHHSEFEYLVHQPDTIAFRISKSVFEFEEKYHSLLEYIGERGRERANRLRQKILAAQKAEANEIEKEKAPPVITVESLQAEFEIIKKKFAFRNDRQQLNRFPFIKPEVRTTSDGKMILKHTHHPTGNKLPISQVKLVSDIIKSVEGNLFPNNNNNNSSCSSMINNSNQLKLEKVTQQSAIVSKGNLKNSVFLKGSYDSKGDNSVEQQENSCFSSSIVNSRRLDQSGLRLQGAAGVQENSNNNNSSTGLIRIVNRTRSLHEEGTDIQRNSLRKSLESSRIIESQQERLSPEMKRIQFLGTSRKDRSSLHQSQTQSSFILGKSLTSRKGTESTDSSPRKCEETIPMIGSMKNLMNFRLVSKGLGSGFVVENREKEISSISAQNSPKKFRVSSEQGSFTSLGSPEKQVSKNSRFFIVESSGSKSNWDNIECEDDESPENKPIHSGLGSIYSHRVRGRLSQGTLESFSKYNTTRLKILPKQSFQNFPVQQRSTVLNSFQQVKHKSVKLDYLNSKSNSLNASMAQWHSPEKEIRG